MTKKSRFQLEFGLSIFIFLLGIYIPYHAYYIASGPIGFFESLFYLLLCVGITLNTSFNFFSKKWTNKFKISPLLLCLVGTFLAFSIFYVDQQTFEKIDWEINSETRKQIISDIKNNKIKVDENMLVRVKTFIPISNGGNEISIRKCETGITVKFWIDRGFLDFHSEFVFTDCPEDIIYIKKILKRNNNSELYKEIEPNWYRLNNY